MRKGQMIVSRKSLDGLSEQEGAFVAHYLRNGGNATEAARDAGYNNPAPTGSRLIRKQRIYEAIASTALPRLGRMIHNATDLIEAQLDAWKAIVHENPRAAAMLPTKELRGILAMGLSRLLPAPEPAGGHSDALTQDTVEDLEARLASLLTARSLAARVIAGDANVIEDDGANPARSVAVLDD